MHRLLTLSLIVLVLTGCGTPSLLITPVSNSNQLEETEVAPASAWFGGKIAIVEVEGMLVNAKSGGLLEPTENVVSLFTQELNKAAADDDVKAVVLRVNSPGGTVLALNRLRI
jgi:protease-4